jgi:hypothetical protein
MIEVMAKKKVTPEPKASPPIKPAKAGKKSIKPETSNKKEVSAPKIYFCSFCGKSSETRRRLIAGPNNAFICDECVEVCNAIFLDEDKEFWKERLINLISGKIKHKVKKVKDTKKSKTDKKKKNNA